MNEPTYKDTERVVCLKKDWAELHPTDQATLLVEWGEETAADFKRDWKGKLLTWGKWFIQAIAGALTLAAAGYGVMSLSSCTEVTPAQIQSVHALYHVVSGERCIFVIEESK